jgi:hypothetical protein
MLPNFFADRTEISADEQGLPVWSQPNPALQPSMLL